MFIYYFISSNFVCLKFQNINFLSHFSVRPTRLKLDTHRGKRLIYCVHQIQTARIYLFLYFFLSLLLAKIKNLHLQNCFNLPLMATAGVCELCSLSAILSFKLLTCLRLDHMRSQAHKNISSHLYNSYANGYKKDCSRDIFIRTLGRVAQYSCFFVKCQTALFRNKVYTRYFSNVLFLTCDNEFSGKIYSIFRGRQNIFLTIFSTKFVVKCATKNLID